MIDREALWLTFESFMLSFRRFISLIKDLGRTADSEEGDDESDGLLESMEMSRRDPSVSQQYFILIAFLLFVSMPIPFRLHIFTSPSSPPSHDERSRENKHLVNVGWRA